MHTGGVEAGYLGIMLVLVVGIAVVVYGWLSDRIDTKRRQSALGQPPDRPIPGLDDDSPSPSYLSEADALRPAPDLPPIVSEEQATAIRQQLNGAPSFAHGHVAAEFATEAGGLCILTNPLILVADAAITTVRELLPLLEKAREDDRQIVVVAPHLNPETIATLAVNTIQRTLIGCAVELADAGPRRSLSSLVGAEPLGLADLRAGYLPEAALGTCAVWVSSTEQLWVIGE